MLAMLLGADRQQAGSYRWHVLFYSVEERSAKVVQHVTGMKLFIPTTYPALPEGSFIKCAARVRSEPS